MVLSLVLAMNLGVFGLPRQLGDPHIRPPRPTSRFTRQVAVSRVQSVHAHRIVLHRPGAPLVVYVDTGTPIFLEGRLGRLSDLHPGEQVRVSYDAVNGPPHANWIELLRSCP